MQNTHPDHKQALEINVHRDSGYQMRNWTQVMFPKALLKLKNQMILDGKTNHNASLKVRLVRSKAPNFTLHVQVSFLMLWCGLLTNMWSIKKVKDFFFLRFTDFKIFTFIAIFEIMYSCFLHIPHCGYMGPCIAFPFISHLEIKINQICFLKK